MGLNFGPGGEGTDTAQGASLPVLASAGADREILRGYPARLHGEGTYSPAGRSFSVFWEQIGEGERVFLSSTDALSPTFLAPLTEQTLRFRITADDGLWTTTDEVILHVRRAPSATAPRVAAGPDRYLTSDSDIPSDADLITPIPTGVTVGWEEVQPVPSPLRMPGEEPDLAARIYRLRSTRDGLRGAPDYLILREPTGRVGNQAPTASLTAPASVTPGATFTLDATGSTDVNGDPLRYRFEQVGGTAPLSRSLLATQPSLVEVVAPNRAQELVLRLFVSDGELESAPAQVSVVVASPRGNPPQVATQGDLRVHPGNWVVLDADGFLLPVEPSVSFEWTQTFILGEPVSLTLEANGRFAQFHAPAAMGDLAFAVVARLPVDETQIESAPTVARVTVVDTGDNTAPNIYLCSESATLNGVPSKIVTAQVSDPEWDEVLAPQWSAETDGSQPLALAVRSSAEVTTTQLCTAPASESFTGTMFFQATFAEPNYPTSVTITFSVCDELAACNEQAHVIAIP